MKNNKENRCKQIINDNITTAILVDGGFFRKRFRYIFGEKNPDETADYLESYCKRHLKEKIGDTEHYHTLYRIFYYDCPPATKAVFNPIEKKNNELSKTEVASWSNSFFDCLKKKRKFALRMGEISNVGVGYYLSPQKTKELLSGKIKVEDLKENDLSLMLPQKGVDMRIGVDIASLAFQKQVNQIVLIAGDSDFVPAAKLARRQGIDFVLDPLGIKIKDNLFEHIDGLNTKDNKFTLKQ